MSDKCDSDGNDKCLNTDVTINNLKIEIATKKEFFLNSFFPQNWQSFSDAVANSISLFFSVRGGGDFAKIKLQNCNYKL